MKAWNFFWLRRDKPVVNKFDIMNHFLSGAGEGYVQVPEEMRYILDFIQNDLVPQSYDVTMTYHLGRASKGSTVVDKYNELNSMEDVVRYKYDLVQRRKAFSSYIFLPALNTACSARVLLLLAPEPRLLILLLLVIMTLSEWVKIC